MMKVVYLPQEKLRGISLLLYVNQNVVIETHETCMWSLVFFRTQYSPFKSVANGISSCNKCLPILKVTLSAC